MLKMAKASPGQSRFLPNPKGRLFDQVREVLRFHHYALRTEKTYVQWIRRYLGFHRRADRSGPDQGWRHPKELGETEAAQFLSHLAMERDVSASTQNQALNALVFLYEQVLVRPLGDLGEFARVS